MFRDKVLQIAGLCDGHFWVQDSAGDPRLLPLREIMVLQGGTKAILWAQIKHVDRAITKATTRYNGDIFRIYDFVRQRIIFTSVSGICECLDCLKADPDVEIVAIRNLVDPQREASGNAGFRDVLVIMRLVTRATKWWGVSGHQCELSLVHRDMQALLNPSQHERYLRYSRLCLYAQINSPGKGRLPIPKLEVGPLLYAFKSIARKFQHSNLSRMIQGESSNAQPDTPAPFGAHNLGVGQSGHGLGGVEKQNFQAIDETEAWKRMSSFIEYPHGSTRGLMVMRAAEFVRLRNNFPGGFLDTWLHEVRHGVKHADATMVLFTNPAAVMTKTPILLIVLAAGVYFTWDFFHPGGRLNTAIQQSSFEARHMRFTALEARDPTLDASAVAIEEFGALQDGCQVNLDYSHWGWKVLKSAPHTYVTLRDGPTGAAQAFQANGFYIKTSGRQGSQGSDPMRFLVHRSRHEGADPKEIAEDDWILESGAGCFFGLNDLKCVPRKSLTFILPDARGEMVRFDVRSPWFMYLGTIVVYVPIMTGCLLCPILGFFGYYYWSRSAFAFNFWMPGVLEVTTAIGMLVDQQDFPQNDSFYWWLLGLSSMVFGFVIQFYAALFMRYIPVHFFITIVGLNIHNSFIIKELGFEIPISPSITFVFWICFCLSRLVLLKRSVRRVQEDVTRYESEWRAICDDPEKARDLARLDDLVHRQCQTKARPQQKSSLEKVKRALSQKESFLPHLAWPSVNSAAPISSLDQLYLQAALLEPIFVAKVKQIAQQSSGMCLQQGRIVLASNQRTATDATEVLGSTQEENQAGEAPGPGNRYLRWSDDDENNFARQAHRLCLKSVDRAVEKLWRSYNCDVSVLLDLVRQCIIFESLSDMIRAVETLRQDPEIEIKRVKNRLSPSYDESLSLGYRDVLFNICINSPATRELGISNHVCEILLILRRYMDHKSLLGHKRYVEFRNMRCE